MNNKTKRNLCFIASLLIAVGVPLIVTIIKYNLIQAFLNTKASVKVSIGAAIIIIVLFFIFYKKLVKYMESLEYSFALSVLKGAIKLVPLICALLIFVNMLSTIGDIVYVVSWIVGCNTVSLLVLDPLTEKYNYLSKRDSQKTLIKESVS